MHGQTILLVAALAFVSSAADSSETVGLVSVEANAAVVVLEPMSGDRRLISLPSLEYVLTIEPQCAMNTRAEAISVSVADTRKTFSGKDIGQQASIEISLTIPQQQIAPIAIHEFCLADDNKQDGDSVLYLNDVLTAQLSLRCAGDNARSIIYATLPLDVDLQCRMNDSKSDASNDQVASPASVPR